MSLARVSWVAKEEMNDVAAAADGGDDDVSRDAHCQQCSCGDAVEVFVSLAFRVQESAKPRWCTRQSLT